jgi:hypothetical protein
MKRCLIIGCSETKVTTPDELPAIQRYDGPSFRVLRRFLVDAPTNLKNELDVFILSAEFGLINDQQAIPVYDRRMTRRRAEELRPAILDSFKHQIAIQNYAELFLSMGKTYLLALAGYEGLLPTTTTVIVSQRSSGRKLTELKAWLTRQEEQPPQLPLPLSDSNNNGQLYHPVKGTARIQGVTLTLTADEVYQIGREAIAAEVDDPYNFKRWYVLIDETRVSPKWLVSQMTNLPVSNFDASAARRVLKALGVSVYKNNH